MDVADPPPSGGLNSQSSIDNSKLGMEPTKCQPTKDYVRNYRQIMQNKPNFPEAQMNVNPYNTTDYENKSNPTLGENKPNSNPNKPNLPERRIDAKYLFTKDYEEKCG